MLGYIAKWFIRTFFPAVARSMEQEGQLAFGERSADSETANAASCVEVEDHGADTTLICFAGMAVLYAAMPKYEFRKTLLECGGEFNFVWVRDVHRSWYNRAPDGSPGGFDAYARLIGDALAQLPSKRNIAIGASGGAAAAFALSRVLPIQRIVAFNPAFPVADYCAVAQIVKAVCRPRKLIFDPRDYFEGVLVLTATNLLWRHLRRIVGPENVHDSLDYYVGKDFTARATVFYGEQCGSDARQTACFKGVPSVTLVPVRSGRHNSMADLKQRGELAPLIHREILDTE